MKNFYRHTITVLLLTLSLPLFSQEKSSLVGLTGFYADFDEYLSGLGYSVNYQYSLNDYFTIEGVLSHASGNQFPDNFERVNNIIPNEFSGKAYLSSSITNIGFHAHITFINGGRNFFSFYAGLGYMFVNSSDYFSSTFFQTIDGEIREFDSYIISNIRRRMLSRTIGIQYRYKLKNGIQMGVDVKILQPFKDNRDDIYFSLNNYRSVGLIIVKTF